MREDDAQPVRPTYTDRRPSTAYSAHSDTPLIPHQGRSATSSALNLASKPDQADRDRAAAWDPDREVHVGIIKEVQALLAKYAPGRTEPQRRDIYELLKEAGLKLPHQIEDLIARKERKDSLKSVPKGLVDTTGFMVQNTILATLPLLPETYQRVIVGAVAALLNGVITTAGPTIAEKWGPNANPIVAKAAPQPFFTPPYASNSHDVPLNVDSFISFMVDAIATQIIESAAEIDPEMRVAIAPAAQALAGIMKALKQEQNNRVIVQEGGKHHRQLWLDPEGPSALAAKLIEGGSLPQSLSDKEKDGIRKHIASGQQGYLPGFGKWTADAARDVMDRTVPSLQLAGRSPKTVATATTQIFAVLAAVLSQLESVKESENRVQLQLMLIIGAALLGPFYGYAGFRLNVEGGLVALGWPKHADLKRQYFPGTASASAAADIPLRDLERRDPVEALSDDDTFSAFTIGDDEHPSGFGSMAASGVLEPVAEEPDESGSSSPSAPRAARPPSEHGSDVAGAPTGALPTR